MERDYVKTEIVLTAIILIIACFAMGITVYKRVDKFPGDITMENYTEFMQVDCRIGSGAGGGGVMDFKYYVTVRANPYYSLENVTIAYSLKSNGAVLPDGVFTVTVEAGGYHSEEFQGRFDLTHNGDYTFGSVIPTLEITVKSVTGTYKYSI